MGGFGFLGERWVWVQRFGQRAMMEKTQCAKDAEREVLSAGKFECGGGTKGL